VLELGWPYDEVAPVVLVAPPRRNDDADDVLVEVGRPEVDIGRLVELMPVRDGEPEGADGEEPESCVSGWLLLELAGRPPDRLLEPGRPLADDPPKPLELPAEERTPDCPPKLKPPPLERDIWLVLSRSCRELGRSCTAAAPPLGYCCQGAQDGGWARSAAMRTRGSRPKPTTTTESEALA